MRILGLDLSLTSTGYVLLDDDQVIWFGSVSPKSREVERLAQFHDWLVAAIADRYDDRNPRSIGVGPLDAVALEGYSYGSPQGRTHAFAIGELGGVMKLALWNAQITTLVIPPATWKKQLLGKGNLNKRDVAVEAFKRYGVEFNNEDTLDAWCVAMCARRQLLGLAEPPKRTRRLSAGKNVPPQEDAADQEGPTQTRLASLTETA